MRVLFASCLWVLACIAAPAHAGPAVLGLHLGTLHSRPGLCNLNPGLYATWANGLTAGAYRNSDCGTSAYLVRTWSTAGPVRFAVSAGAVTGYAAHPVLPLLLPSVVKDLSRTTAVRLTYVPKFEKRGAHALHLSLEWTL